MTSKSNAWRVGVLALGAAFVLVGCGSSVGGDANPSGSATATNVGTGVAADVPSGFKPCEDIPQSVLDSEKLRMKIPADSNASGGIKWRGCQWVQSGGGYGATIQTTNITLEMVRDRKFRDTQEFTLDGRRAISTRQIEDRPETTCTLNTEMQGGSLEISLTNPSTATTAHLDTCELTRALAQKIVPAIPAGA
ncbi:uncharacterized protein DUF3558 [Nocardia bhagyanarayanae]|uniref:Uncharacterized protein DUF3558 n=2 Tax=Nocardia bhagyanarayanae TaxID=1215925 RepID=A0A543FDL8_9NOCA|nr:uncharacterized protein DUF3558 [Nocardia bhagyanarayanae]